MLDNYLIIMVMGAAACVVCAISAIKSAFSCRELARTANACRRLMQDEHEFLEVRAEMAIVKGLIDQVKEQSDRQLANFRSLNGRFSHLLKEADAPAGSDEPAQSSSRDELKRVAGRLTRERNAANPQA